jgi:UDP-glucose 4-epimerase
MKKQSILVTGGAGYIGSHVVKQLRQLNRPVIVLDNLSTGYRQAVTYGELVVGNTGDIELVTALLQKHDIGAVMHFAAHSIVHESMQDPLKYYANNTCNTRNLLECCQQAGVEHFIFSSTAAVYGALSSGLADEQTPTAPINPYGHSKLMSEQMLNDLSASSALRHVSLRYFNVAGADHELDIGPAMKDATLLIKVAAEASVGKRDSISIFGTDYPTIDGTGVRDYIHVEDIAEAHINALSYLENNGASVTLNCGYGHGYSVRQVLDAVNRQTATPLTIHEMPRRPGDPAEIIADASRIGAVLGWQARHDDLEYIVRTALEWEKKLGTLNWQN